MHRLFPPFLREFLCSLFIFVLSLCLLLPIPLPAQESSITVTFDNPAPPGSSGSFLNGVFQGINFGTGQWRWEGAFGSDSTNNIYFDSAAGSSRAFTFSSGPQVLISMRVFTGITGTLTLTDNLGQTRTQTITTGSMQTVTTGWIQPSTTITVSFTADWAFGIDDITYRAESATFLDDFNRPNSPNLGNGWTVKYPPAFAIRNDQVVDFDTGVIDYHDAIAYRPMSEDQLDVEVGIEFQILPGQNFPQVHARIQRNTISQPNTLDDYILFVDGFAASPGRAVIARQPPVADQFECYMLGILFPSPLEQTDRYRLRLRVVGENPVMLMGFVDRFNGTAWQVFATGTVVHDNNTQPIPGDYCGPGFMPPPITTPGAVGFGKWRTANEVYDTFTWTNLSASNPNPVPNLNSLSPASSASGGTAFTLTVTGSGFINSSVVQWNGANRTTTFVSGTQLTAAIPANDIATAGTAQVTVFNPEPGGGTSNAQTFTINAASNPVPTTSGLTPSSATAEGGAFTLTVNGNGFVNGSVVRWNGANRTTTFISATQLTAAIPATDIAVAGTASVTVFNPAPGGGTSNAQTFTISNSSSTTVTFDNPAPPGSSGSLLNGIFLGINFGTGQWSWEGPYGADNTNHIYFNSASGTSRAFTFSPGPRFLTSLRVFTGTTGTLTLTDNLGQTRTQTITTGSMQTVTTGWTQASTTITVQFTAGWELGVDDITYRMP